MSRRVWMEESGPEHRCGVKGPGAAAALAGLDLAVPADPNTWAPLNAVDDIRSIVARLGNTEFFLEESGDAPGIAALVAGQYAGAYPVLREDRAIVLGGPAAAQAMAEVCNIDFSAARGRAVIMTTMMGVAVLVIPQASDELGPIYRIWCDPSFGWYLWEELEKIVTRIESGSDI